PSLGRSTPHTVCFIDEKAGWTAPLGYRHVQNLKLSGVEILPESFPSLSAVAGHRFDSHHTKSFFKIKFRVLPEMQPDIVYQGTIGIAVIRTHRRSLSVAKQIRRFQGSRRAFVAKMKFPSPGIDSSTNRVES